MSITTAQHVSPLQDAAAPASECADNLLLPKPGGPLTETQVVSYLEEVFGVKRSVEVIRGMANQGVLQPQTRKTPRGPVAEHYTRSDIDALAPWFKTEDALLEGTAKPTDDGQLWILTEDGKLKNVGHEGKLYTIAQIAKKRQTSEWLVKKELRTAKKELLAEAKEGAVTKKIGKEVYGVFELLLSEVDEAIIRKALNKRIRRIGRLENSDTWKNPSGCRDALNLKKQSAIFELSECLKCWDEKELVDTIEGRSERTGIVPLEYATGEDGERLKVEAGKHKDGKTKYEYVVTKFGEVPKNSEHTFFNFPQVKVKWNEPSDNHKKRIKELVEAAGDAGLPYDTLTNVMKEDGIVGKRLSRIMQEAGVTVASGKKDESGICRITHEGGRPPAKRRLLNDTANWLLELFRAKKKPLLRAAVLRQAKIDGFSHNQVDKAAKEVLKCKCSEPFTLKSDEGGRVLLAHGVFWYRPLDEGTNEDAAGPDQKPPSKEMMLVSAREYLKDREKDLAAEKEAAEAAMFSVAEASELSGVDPGTISKAVDAGEIKNNGLKGKGKRKINIEDFTRWKLERDKKRK